MKILITILLFTFSTLSFAGHIVKSRLHLKTKKRQVLSSYSINMGNRKKVLKKIREFIDESHPTAATLYTEVYYPTPMPNEFSVFSGQAPIAGEVKALVKQGPDSNRIILTILGDGYTLSEKQKFFQDAQRIVGDLFKEITFKSYLPLFNIYAVFTPSKDSGITDLTRKNTAFGLYRTPKGSKRGVMPGNRSAIERALKLAGPHTDYPVIIANDDFYGGLGGRYAITTRSKLSGSMVLRHELGHNFSNVGEEYDGGQVYSGANFSRTTNVSWKHWLTPAGVGPFRHEVLHGNYVWKNLAPGATTELKFSSPSELNYQLTLSAVGWQQKGDMQVRLNGSLLPLNGIFSLDRSFFKSKLLPMKKGKYTLSVKNTSQHVITLAFAQGKGYPANYMFNNNLVNAYSVYSQGGRFAGYRPTHGMCLMRDMRSKKFCPVDQENIWLRFLDRINLIDGIKIEAGGLVTIKTLKVGMTSVRWLKKQANGKWFELDQYYNSTKVVLSPGKYQIRTYFNHPEIRKMDERRRGLLEFSIK